MSCKNEAKTPQSVAGQAVEMIYQDRPKPKKILSLLDKKQITLSEALQQIDASSRQFEIAFRNYIQGSKISPEEVELILQKNPRPQVAYLLALNGYNNKIIREIACRDPEAALNLAIHVDRAPSDETRQAACEKPGIALQYAVYVDKSPHELTRKACCHQAQLAYEYALKIDKGPRDDTRRAACKSPFYAYCFAEKIDQGPIPSPDGWQAVTPNSP